MIIRSLPDLLRLRAEQDPDKTAILVEGVAELTFADWLERAGSVAGWLAERGVKPGERVGLLYAARDWTDFAVAFLGAQLAGAAAVPLSDRLAPADLAYMLGDCQSVAVLHSESLTPPEGPWWTSPLTADRYDDPKRDAAPRDLAQILYTSGTTGRPKGVAASHANLAYGVETRANRRRFGHSRHLLHAFPIGTNAGQTMLLNALDAKPTMLTLPRFTPARFARLIEARQVGTVFLVPSMAIELLDSGMPDKHDLSSVRLLGSAAAALPPALAVRLAAAFPKATVTNYYTSTEAAPAQTIMIFDQERPAALGRPAAGSGLRICDEKGEPVAPGEVGDVWLRSPTASRSYYNDSGSSAFRDGWIRMGDVGYLDVDGYLYLVDRAGDVVKTGAFKVSTLQVEAALYEHPHVAEAAVFGVPHPVLGSVLAAAVVARGGQELTPREIRDFLMSRVARHELPEKVAVLDSLPKNQSGKVLKRSLPELMERG